MSQICLLGFDVAKEQKVPKRPWKNLTPNSEVAKPAVSANDQPMRNSRCGPSSNDDGSSVDEPDHNGSDKAITWDH